MNTTCIRELVSTDSYLAERLARVDEIRSKHSKKLFGYADATIGEIRMEAIKRRFEAIYNN